jgi:hypothetical protein
MKVRRIVTGHRNGLATCVRDEEVDGITLTQQPGTEFHRLWGADETVTFPDDGAMPAHESYFPPVGGFRFEIVTLPPGTGLEPAEPSPPATPEEVQAAIREGIEKIGMPGPAESRWPRPRAGEKPGMHASDTIDMIVMLSGELSMELEDHTMLHLRPGDTLVQNGTMHAWSVPGDEPARFAVFLVGAYGPGNSPPAAG